MRPKIKIWIENEAGDILFGEGKTSLLERIDALGSISKAAAEVGMDYKKAWGHIYLIEKKINNMIIVRKKGGKNGGGSALTQKGRELIHAYRAYREAVIAFSDEKFQELFVRDGKMLVEPQGSKNA